MYSSSSWLVCRDSAGGFSPVPCSLFVSQNVSGILFAHSSKLSHMTMHFSVDNAEPFVGMICFIGNESDA